MPASHTRALCFARASGRSTLILVRATDDANFARTIIISDFRSCFEDRTRTAANFDSWKTPEGIGLGSSGKAVRAAYGPPSEVETAGAYFPDFGTIGKAHSAQIPAVDQLLEYRSDPNSNEVDLSECTFGIKNGKVAWILISDDE